MRLLAALLLAVTIVPAAAKSPEDMALYWPGVTYDEAIPRIEQVLGYQPGTVITRPEHALAYFRALEAAAPERIEIFEYATSWERRPLIYAVIGTPERLDNLGAIKADIARLADPRKTDAAAAEQLVQTLPGTVWLSYGVHGNEISSTDAAMLTAYHLLAAQDARTAKILDQTLVFIDPLQNPDGRARFVQHFEQAMGLKPFADRIAAEHDEPWPGGRTNHYLFDLNRDWFRISQPETRGRVAALRQWLPLAMVDAHEMGGDSTYFFAPEAVPYNPHLTADQKRNLALFGENHARYFDRFGIDYFTREIYDAFYPGYGASWPSYYGGIAMTYEQGSARGLVFERYDGSTLSYAEGVRNHFVTSVSTAEAVADNREKLLADFYAYRRSAVDEGMSGDLKSYILPTQTNQAGADELARLLAFQGVEVRRADAAFDACGADYEAGSYVIDLAQPETRRARVLLDRNVPMAEDFIAEQEKRRAAGLPDQIYDVTAWSLPLMFNVTADRCGERPAVSGPLLTGQEAPAGCLANPDAEVAFLVEWGEAPAARFLANALRRGLYVKSADEAFTLDGTDYSAGTLILDVADNPDDLVAALGELAALTGADIVGVDTSWVTDGPSLGSTKVLTHPEPHVAIAWDTPTSSYSAGNTRFLLEQRYETPVMPVRTERIARADLDDIDVLILPEQSRRSGSYKDMLGQAGAEALKDWVREGGTLIGLGSAVSWLAHPDVGLVSIRREDLAEPEDAPRLPKAEEGEATVEGTVIDSEAQFDGLIRPANAMPDSVPGVIAQVVVDPYHWLGAGLGDTLYAMVRGPQIYTPVTADEGRNVLRFAGAEDLPASGYLWEENRRQLAYKPLAVAEPMGRGVVIAITQGTTTRAYQDGLDLLLVNAVYRGAQQTQR